MKIKRGQIVTVHHSRKGKFLAQASKNFDTETEDWYPFTLAQERPLVNGNGQEQWFQGNSVPCRGSHTTILKGQTTNGEK